MTSLPNPIEILLPPQCDTSQIEKEFPWEKLTPVARLESWRKELYRPVYHIHKWWATRLGSVFKTILLTSLAKDGQNVWEMFYKGADFKDKIVLDPFMGSGTTLGEALKLGCKVIGSDINPVSYFLVKKGLESVDTDKLVAAYHKLEEQIKPYIQPFYKTHCPKTGQLSDILYVFWVMLGHCPHCAHDTSLFNSRIFVSHAYPQRNSKVIAVCPGCGELNQANYGDKEIKCASCCTSYNPQQGSANGQYFTCEKCGQATKIIEAIRKTGLPPQYKMYALSILNPDGEKLYKRPDQFDLDLYRKAADELVNLRLPIPDEAIEDGHNTRQVLNYNITKWRDMFNARQLLCLGTLLKEILREPDVSIREFLLLLFSGTLEFNNMLCSFKGEGTGAVRHIFSHHILKPERTSLENNVWGTPKSSGSFSTLFNSRLLRAKEYCDNPFEIKAVWEGGKFKGEKVYRGNKPIKGKIVKAFSELVSSNEQAIFLHCGDSALLPIPDKSVDLVVTDPPYFDNVHYSELADFFYVWLRQGLAGSDAAFNQLTTRHPREVQDTDPHAFAESFGSVLKEMARVIKPEGLIVFTFHHSRPEGWLSVYTALQKAGLAVSAVHPIKAEMSVAMPKTQSKTPIDIDAIIVARKLKQPDIDRSADIKPAVIREARSIIKQMNGEGLNLSQGDIRVILCAYFLKESCSGNGHNGFSPQPGSPSIILNHILEEEEPLYNAQQIKRKDLGQQLKLWQG